MRRLYRLAHQRISWFKPGLIALPAALLALLLFTSSFRHSEDASIIDRSGPQEGGLTVVTLNIAKETNVHRILRELSQVPALASPDLFLMQEVPGTEAGLSVAEQLAAAMEYKVSYSPAKTGVTDQGLAILSRYPLDDAHVSVLKSFNLVFHNRSRIALSVTVRTPDGPLRVTNAHLDTRINVSDRIAQLEPVIKENAKWHGPTLVGGDFNTNNFYWVGHVLPIPAPNSQAAGIQRIMARYGFRTPIPAFQPTFDHLDMHLDWVFLNGLGSHGAAVYPLRFSDHHAVWVRLAWPNGSGGNRPAGQQQTGG